MKKLKKFAALVLAAAMVLSMGITSFAADDGSIVIRGTKAAAQGQTSKIVAYRMFNTVKTGSTVEYTLNEEFVEFFKDAIPSDETGDALSDAAYEYVAGIQRSNESNKKVEFAEKALAWIMGQEKTEPGTDFSAVRTSVNAAEGSTTISGLAFGMYLVYPQGASDVTNVTGSTNNEKSPAMIVTVADSNAVNINIKSTYPTVDKEITDDKDSNERYDFVGVSVNSNWQYIHDMVLDSLNGGANAEDYQIGDTVTFKLTSTVPDMTGFTDYTFKIHDTLSAGLDYYGMLYVKVDGTEIEPVSNEEDTKSYTISYDEDTRTLTITLNDFYDQYKNMAGKKIEIEYEAILNKNAVTGMDPNTNSAKVEFSNDPTTETTDESTPDKVDVHTFDFKINKVNEKEAGLTGVTFTLHTAETCIDSNRVPLIDDGTGAFRPVVDKETATYVITTGEDGTVVVKGLQAGTYWLKEVSTQDGYHLLDGPIKVEIVPTYSDTTGELEKYTVKYTYNGTETVVENNQTGTFPVIKVVNKDGTILPDTGGMGTVIFTVAGLVLIIGVGASFVVSRRKRDAR